MSDRYREFLEQKIRLARPEGLSVAESEINPALKDFNRAIVAWALRGGRRAIFASFGLHKTAMQIEIMRLLKREVGGPMLIVLPLGVRGEFLADAQNYFTGDFAVRLKFIRRPHEIDPDADIHLANYETIRDGKLDPSLFTGASLDEAAVLRGFGSTKTFREFMRLFDTVRFKFVATATPSPNEYIELLAYAAFLDIMDVGQAKTRFFRRDSEKADALTLHPHKEREFWLWVASWALFIQKPSDLGFPDEGYVLPDLVVRWHEVPSDPTKAGAERDGQMRLMLNAASSLPEAAREKRGSISSRVGRLTEIVAGDPSSHRLIWHDLEVEREAVTAALPKARAVYGSQEFEERERHVVDFKEGRLPFLAAKPSMLGAGCNFQAHCHKAAFLGISHKFHDFIQAVHRIQRFGQANTCEVDIIHTEAERAIRLELIEKWQRHDEQMARMSAIIREFGLAQASRAGLLARSIGVEREEVRGDDFRLVNADCVEETQRMEDDSVDLIVTSIPFSTQYEYTPSYNDFGHTDDDAHFWAQMDFLTPQLLRVLKPGRDAFIHVKDRIVPGGMTGLGFQTVSPFSDACIAHFRRHGFAFLARKTVVTDVVRENNQTYRLGWSEQCKDGTRMGAGMPEYVLMFRKAPTDRSNGYADVPVVKAMPMGTTPDGRTIPWTGKERLNPVPGTGYSRGRWQLDAHGFARSSGDRLLTAADLIGIAPDHVYKLFRAFSAETVYDHEHHVRLCEELDARGSLPPTFMLLPPQSWHPDVWTDITRMRTLNGAQYAAGKEMHLCPLQFDIVDRAIRQCSMPGETVFDPFGGLMTVPYRALKMGRKGVGIELNPAYFRDGVAYVEAAAAERAVPSLFDLLAAPEAAE